MLAKPLISFDYAIKYLLKNKGDYDIIEGFISALLAIQGYKPVKINALLDGESNKETAELKRSIADLVVEDEDGNKYIVEIERTLTANFMHKACFNTSRLVVDSIYGNQNYTAIKKVFHISLLYFSKKEMNKPIYHGKTIIHEIDTENPIDMRIANQGFVVYEHHNVFPEYFFISVLSFNGVINNELDEWLYVMKHSDTREDFKSLYMKKVAERLSILKMSTEERNAYYYYVKEAMQAQDMLTAAKIQGKEEGREEGKIQGEKIGIEKGKRAERYTTVDLLRKKACLSACG
ncbi:PD-(D/E)XK nuclease family transposase [Cardinium endosymbiont of Tipula unca]|uniref:PD-(D/E)XK nuclease family transposase n=1 Tax=Cardinium endosymbiont of Tipula unca TaxID=3066216 RepID=UPI0030CC2919